MAYQAALNGLERDEILDRLSSPEIDEQLHQRFIAHLGQSGASQSVIAKKLGRSTAAVSQYVHRKFQGNLAEMERDVAAMLRREEELEFVSGPADFVITEPSKLMWEVLQYCDEKKRMGAIQAPSGTGKTEACKAYKRKNPKTVLVSADITTRNPSAILRMIAAHIGVNRYLSISDLLGKVIDRLKNSDRLVIMDEGHFLRWEAVEVLRKIYDSAQVGIVLVGQERFFQEMTGKNPRSYLYDQIHSRIAIHRQAFPINKKDSLAIAATFVKGLDKDSLEFLYQRAKGAGRFRYMTNLLDVAIQMSKENGNCDINVPLLQEAERYLVGQ